MKKEKEETPDKAVKKKARNDIQARLVKVIKTITTELGHDALDIEKEAKKLAKKITKGLKVVKKTDKAVAPVSNAKKPVKSDNSTKEKAISKAPAPVEKMPVAKAVPAKPAAPKSGTVKAAPIKAKK